MRFSQPRAAALLLVMLTACGKEGASPASAPPPPPVDIITLSAASATLTDELPGRVTARRTAQVRARVEGVVEAQLFTDGALVKAGAPLFRIDSRAYDAAEKAAVAELASATALLERYRPLREAQAVSAQEFDAQSAKVATAQAAVERARLDRENAHPVAPIGGRAGRALVTEGALVGRGEATPLVTIEQLDPIRVEFTQSHTDWLALRQLVAAGGKRSPMGAAVELVLEDGSTYSRTGTLTFSDQAVDPATGAIIHRAEFPNPDGQLLPGTFVHVRFARAILDQALRVPQRAIITTADAHQVMVVDADNKVAVRPVVTGGMAGGDFIVREGLTAGDRVIVNGLQKIRPGAPVTPVPWVPGTPVLAPVAAAPSAK